jgi:hypothetical protein
MTTRQTNRPGPGNCQCCRHPRRDLLDLALVARTPRPVLSARFGVSVDSLARHAENHLPPQVRAAIMTALAPTAVDLEQLQKSESESLLASLIAQRARLSVMAQQAMEAELPGVAARIESGVLANLELTARLLNQLISHSTVSVRSFLVEPDYLRLRTILIEELRPFPELAARIAQRISELETCAAAAITTAKARPMIEHNGAAT